MSPIYSLLSNPLNYFLFLRLLKRNILIIILNLSQGNILNFPSIQEPGILDNYRDSITENKKEGWGEKPNNDGHDRDERHDIKCGFSYFPLNTNLIPILSKITEIYLLLLIYSQSTAMLTVHMTNFD